MAEMTPPVYQTITGRHIPVSKLSRSEKEFLSLVQQKYHGRLEWTRFAAWWNAEFTRTGLKTNSPVYRICQDLEARLGIHQGSVSPPDYRDFLADLIDGQFGSRQEFCQATGVDPGQLSRVFAGRAGLIPASVAQGRSRFCRRSSSSRPSSKPASKPAWLRAAEALALATH